MANRHFLISDKCSSEQRHLFETLNRAIDKFGISADDLDRFFRLQVMQQCYTLADTAEINTEKFMLTQIGEQIPLEAAQWLNRAETILASETIQVTPIRRQVMGNEQINALTAEIKSLEPAFTSNIANGIGTIIGRFQDINPALLKDDERRIYNRFTHSTLDTSKPAHSTLAPNLLQECANGKPLLNKEGTYSLWDDIGGFKLETGAYSTYIRNALLLAVQQAAIKTGKIAGQQPIVDSLIETTDKMLGVTRTTTASPYSASTGRVTPEYFGPPIPRPKHVDRIEARKRAKEEQKGTNTTPEPKPVTDPAEVERRRREFEDRTQRQAEEAMLAIIPFAFSGMAQSVLDRGNPARALPAKPSEAATALNLQDIVTREIQPVKDALNSNFEPHRTLGEVLFSEGNFQVMRTIDHIATNARPPADNEALRAKAQERIKHILTMQLDDSSLHQANRQNHEQLVAALGNAPVLIVAAIGTPDMVREIKDIQQKLFPERKKDRPDPERQAELIRQRADVAVRALERANIPPPPALMAASTQAQADRPTPDNPTIVDVGGGTAMAAAAASPPPPPPPPPPPTDPLPPEEPGGDPENRNPLTAEQIIARADSFARGELPDHFQLRARLVPRPDHPIVLTLTDAQGHEVPTRITTFEPNLDRALALKQQVQAHLLSIPGIVGYRSPMRNGRINLQLDELIPSPPPRSQLKTRFGAYRLQLQWPALHEDMSISLGIDHNAPNRPEAELRFHHANDFLAALRTQNPPTSHYLPITKGDLIDHMRQWVRNRGQQWHEPIQGPIDQFPATVRLPFSGPNNDQNCWLHIDPLRPDGDPNFTWTLPMRWVVNGTQLVASAHINLHVRDRRVAETRAIDTVNQLLLQLQEFCRPGGGFVINPANAAELQPLSVAERDAAPQLIDSNRLQDMYNLLRSPLQQDLEVRQIAAPEESAGGLRYTIGVFRGGCDGLAEHVLERNPTANAAPLLITRSFIVPRRNAADFTRFVEAVNRSFTNTIHDAYDPRSHINYNHTTREVLNGGPQDFNPAYAPRVLNDAIRTHLVDYPAFTPDRVYPPPPGRRTGGDNRTNGPSR